MDTKIHTELPAPGPHFSAAQSTHLPIASLPPVPGPPAPHFLETEGKARENEITHPEAEAQES